MYNQTPRQVSTCRGFLFQSVGEGLDPPVNPIPLHFSILCVKVNIPPEGNYKKEEQTMFSTTGFDGPDGILIIGSLLVLAVQLLLCFKVKNIFLKLIPMILLIISTIALYVVGQSLDPWEGFAYGVLSAFSFIWLIVCGVCWGIWAIAGKRGGES
jgi:hypothetical protein